MTFAQIQADAEAHLADLRANPSLAGFDELGPRLAAKLEKTTQLVCVLASELAARTTLFDAGSGRAVGELVAVSKSKRTRKAS